MNSADLARLEIAKRAYKATQADSSEVQTGVRRARLSLRRPKGRRSWFSKGLVLVVLAVGGLAYAKPHALGDLIGDMLPQLRGSAKPVAKLGGAPESVIAAPQAPALPQRHVRKATLPHSMPPAEKPAETTASSATASSATASNATASSATTSGATKKTKPMRRAVETTPGTSAESTGLGPTPTSVVSDWGRVGQALARGDENQALTALQELSESDDQRTRDKADLGRAQLLMAHGDRDGACSLARSLTHRRAGGRIERQAQTLLKSCAR